MGLRGVGNGRGENDGSPVDQTFYPAWRPPATSGREAGTNQG
jgi:hypothetical protein